MSYEELVALARDDPNVLGLVLTGSRGAGALVRRGARRREANAPAGGRSLAPERLDDYVNSYFRSAKSHRLGRLFEAQLDATESIPPLLDTLCALHGRVRPFNKLLQWELEREPLGGDVWAVEVLLPRLGAILATG